MTRSSMEDDERLRQKIDEVQESPAQDKRLKNSGSKGWIVVLLVLLGCAALYSVWRNQDVEEKVVDEQPERETLSPKRLMVQDLKKPPVSPFQTLVDPLVGMVLPETKKVQMTEEEMQHLEFEALQLGKQITVPIERPSQMSTQGGNQYAGQSGGYSNPGYGAPPPGVYGSYAGRNDQLADSPYGRPTESQITETVYPHTLWNNTNRILEGTRVQAVLLTPIDTTLAGPVEAMISHDVFAASGNRRLFRKGDTVLG